MYQVFLSQGEQIFLKCIVSTLISSKSIKLNIFSVTMMTTLNQRSRYSGPQQWDGELDVGFVPTLNAVEPSCFCIITGPAEIQSCSQ